MAERTAATYTALPTQPIRQLLLTGGNFAANGGSGGPVAGSVGMIRSFAGNFDAFSTSDADGRMLPVQGNTPVFSLLYNAFGGDGRSTFALPDLRGRAAVGGRHLTALAPVDATRPEVTLTCMIAADAGIYPNNGDVPLTLIGMIGLFAGNYVPSGWLPADGQLIDPQRYESLCVLLGNTYGGDGRFTFQLPDLNGRPAIGAGAGGARTVGLGETVHGNGSDALGMSYLICVRGTPPVPVGQQDGYPGIGAFPDQPPCVGEIIAFAGPPLSGNMWQPAAGQLLAIADYRNLFAVIGTTYGGDGTTAFAVPDLRGKVMVGTATA